MFRVQIYNDYIEKQAFWEKMFYFLYWTDMITFAK